MTNDDFSHPGTSRQQAASTMKYSLTGGDDMPRDGVAPVAPRYSRRLSDKILIAFHHACDQSDFDIADQLLRVLEAMLTRRPVSPDGNRRRSMESLVAAHERLWHLRHQSDHAN
jgi:hypothetical protein